jgi:ubiquinone/menaquinone biosynthesis C-methylase UbiE
MASSQAPYPAKVKYDERGARGYQRRKPAKHRAEMRLIDRAFALIPKRHRVLDVPCGGGRLMIHLAGKGYTIAGADYSEPMLAVTRETLARRNLTCLLERQDIERMTFPDRSFDTVVCFRLFHHFPTPEIRQRVVSELCRVAAANVVLSYFSPYSYTSLKRRFCGTDRDRFATPLNEVRRYFAVAGFQLVKDFAQSPLLHTLHVAVFDRVGSRQN